MSSLDWISTAPAHEVRAVLLALCESDRVRQHAVECWDAIRSSSPRCRANVAICVQCSLPFNSKDNKYGDCRYHPEELVIDDDSSTWYDWDEPGHGIMDSEESREEYPEGFTFPCCDKDGRAEGCKKGQHESNPYNSLKGQGGSRDPTTPDNEDYEDYYNEDKDNGEGGRAVPPVTAGVKRKAEYDLAVCVLCENPFSEESNGPAACSYHPGELELDENSEVWGDCDPEMGDQDTEANRKDFPEGFIWSCCEEDGAGAACCTGRHETESQHGRPW